MHDSFPRIITLLRTERKLTQKEAAKELGISQALLSHYERGIRECGLDFLCRTADFYGVSCDYLLGRSPERNGSQLTVEDIPDPDTNSVDKRSRGSMIPVLNKKLIANSLNILFDLLQKADCRALTNEASAYIMIAVYKVFRLVYLGNPKNSRSFFAAQDVIARGVSTAALEICESKLEMITSGRSVDGMKGLENVNELELSDELLSQRYPMFSVSLLNLIHTAENHMGYKQDKDKK